MGAGNIFIGNSAGEYYEGSDPSTVSGNIFMGYSAGLNWKTGDKNIIIGNSAARKIIEGSSNIVMGDFAGYYLTETTINKRLLIGYQTKILLHGDLSENRLTINSYSVNPSHTLYVNGLAGGTYAWNNTSDKRLKTNIKPLEGALQSVLKLQGVTFNWKDETNHRPGQNIGFIAQEVKEILPEIVNGGGKDKEGNEIYYSIEYATLTPVLVEAIKEQQEAINKLNTVNKEQQELINKLIEELKTVKEQLKTK